MNDLVSRQAALEMLNDNELERQADGVFDGDLHRYKRAAQRIIAQLPSAEKHGKWIDTGSGQECSECREIQYGYDSGRNYCPNCGADMREERHEDQNYRNDD